MKNYQNYIDSRGEVLQRHTETTTSPNSLISRTDKVELIATEFFSNPETVWVILSNILKVASPILWGSIYIFDLKMITFMLKVAIEDYCLVIWTLLLQLF